METSHFLWLSWITILIFISNSSIAHSQCAKDQSSSLLNLKLSLKFNATFSKTLRTWNSRTDCCTWLGVICEDGRVTLLDLSFQGIYGGLESSSSFFNQLQHLRDLNLAFNNFSSSIPAFFGNLVNLIRFNLSSSHFSGQIPDKIFQIPTLKHLDASGNPLLRGSLPEFSPRNSLQRLILSKTNFTGKLPDTMGNLHQLVKLDLSRSRFIGNLPASICNASNLQSLDLSFNELNGELPSCLFNLSSLEVLRVGGNIFHGRIPESIFDECALNTLDLNDNMFEGKVPISLANCKRLEVFIIGNNQINDEFPCWLMSLMKLRVLVLRSNKFTGTLSCPGTDYFWEMLQIIDISLNNFVGELTSEYFSSWKGMVKISNKYASSIDLSSNKFSGNIPDEIGDLTGLYTLNLSHNALTGHIPTSLGNLKDMEVLDLSRNRVDGSIPTSLVNLTFLAVLDLSFNRLEGAIPTGNQFATFPEDSFQGNEGLCGSIIHKSCRGETEVDLPERKPPAIFEAKSEPGFDIGWQLMISVQIGFSAGFGIIVVPLLFSERWRMYYYYQVDKVVLKTLAMVGYSRTTIKRIQRRMM